MSSDNVGTSDPLNVRSFQMHRTQESVDMFNRMNQGRIRGLDRCMGIMCKMGPSTENLDILVEMIVAGMNIAMIKCVEMSGEDHIREMVQKIREANDKVNRTLNIMFPVAICMKTIGPEIHIGVHQEGEDVQIKLETGSQVTLTFDPAYKDKCNSDILFVNFTGDPKELDLKLRAPVLLNRGKVKLKVREIDLSCVSPVCDVVNGGSLPSKAVISFPNALVDLPIVSEQDVKYIQLAMDLKLDVLMATHVTTENDVQMVRKLLDERKSPMILCASVTDQKGLLNIDDIIRASDGIGIPRGHVERKPVSWNLLLATKIIIAKCRSLSKPIIVTSRFVSKYTGSVELVQSDVANAVQVVMEGADVFGLGYEVAFGGEPVKLIRLFTETCRQANAHVDKNELLVETTNVTFKSSEVLEAVYFTAVTLSLRINAGAIIVITVNGKSARRLSVLRPISPIIAVTRLGHVSRQLHLFKHVYPVQYCQEKRRDAAEEMDARIQFGITYGKFRGLIKTGDPLLIIHDITNHDGIKNTISLMYASNVNVV